MAQTISEAVSRTQSALGYDEAKLFAQLGAALQTAERDPFGVQSLDFRTTESEFPSLDLGDLGRKFFRRFLGSLKDLVCGDDPDDVADRQSILAALGLTDQAAIKAAATAAVVSALGLSGPIAVLVVTILVGRLVSAGFDFVADDLRAALCAKLDEIAN